MEETEKKAAETKFRIPPTHCVVPGTHFTVDWHCKTKPEFIHSFLSHAHTDHIAGIASFRSPRVLHCTPLTGRLILNKYPRLCECIETHAIGSTFEVEKVKVTLLDANHTPGSAMFVFDLPNGQRIMHTGDFRGEKCVLDNVKKFSPVDYLYLDCTYAIANVKAYTREECTNFMINKVKEYVAKGSVALIGTYTLGKEELVIDVAKATGFKVYLQKERQDSITALIQCKMCSEDLFTKEPNEAKIHLVPIQTCKCEAAIEYAAKYSLANVTCFSASGWNGKTNWQKPYTYSHDGVTATVFNIPYSDHSSCEELVSFVKAMVPKKIIPTTASNEKELKKINDLFFPYIAKRKNKSFIDFYASASK